ncbi:MAG TPA: excinuclease ABC subunit UvrC [Bdellovibrionales bacterium]|nr:excinuclease ABC subunit UvrC [Bdellovibrionales bacterium]
MNPALDDLREKVAQFPLEPGVYLMKNGKDKVVYVGKAKALRNRVRSYLGARADHSLKTKYLMMNVVAIDYILTKTEVEAFLLEASLIKKHRPRYNIRLKDDKAYPYIRIGLEHDFPRFYLARRVTNDGAMYFGPYASGLSVRETIRFLNRTFKIRDCTDSFFKTRTRPCISHQIGQCTAPCVKMVRKEAYRNDIESCVSFLKGRNTRILKDLTGRMKNAAGEERFEYAARLRDSIAAIERIWERQTVVTLNKEMDQDVIAFVGDERGTLIETVHVRGGRVIGSRPHFMARFDFTGQGEEIKDWLTSFLNQFYSENIIPDEIILPVDLGFDMIKLLQAVFIERQNKKANIILGTGTEGKKLMDLAMTNAKSHFQDAVSKADQQQKGLEQIQQKFGLKAPPRRMECYDISNFQGTDSVASQVVFEDGLPRKDDYKRYKIKTVEGANDFASMREVLNRRFKHTEWEDPDLIVVDGGKGQLNMAVEALKEIGRPDLCVIGMAKARTLGEFHDQEVISSSERFFLPGRQNPVLFPQNSEAYHILVGLRDEAHRFAITYHRKLRGDRTLASVLDDIVGLGEKRKKALLKTFGSIEEIKKAPIDALTEVPGMNRVIAERVLLQLGETGEEE